MSRGLRAAVLGCVSAIALAFSGSAFAAYTPRLAVLHEFMRLGQSGETLLGFSTGRTDEATFRLTIYAPAGYTVNASQAPGTRVGTAEATVQARAVSQDVFLPVEGVIQADNPANWAPQATQCTGTATHQNVWLLVLTASGRELRVPIFVDTAAGPEAAFASLKMQVCLPPPDVPESSGGAAFGAKVVDATLLFARGVFTLPRARDIYQWIAYSTPYTNFRPPVNAAGTVQSRALVPLPQTITLRATVNRRTGRVTLAGTLNIPGVTLIGQRLRVLAGTNRSRLRASGTTGRVNARSRFTTTRRIRRTTFFQVFIQAVYVADQAGCALPTQAPPAPAGCNATLGVYAVSSVVRARR